jgi:hypothetical protein
LLQEVLIQAASGAGPSQQQGEHAWLLWNSSSNLGAPLQQEQREHCISTVESVLKIVAQFEEILQVSKLVLKPDHGKRRVHHSMPHTSALNSALALKERPN